MTYIIQVACVVAILLCFVFRAYWVKPPPPRVGITWSGISCMYMHDGRIVLPYPDGETRIKFMEGDTLLYECDRDGNGRGVPLDREWLLVAGVEYTIIFEAVPLPGKDVRR